MSYTVQIRPAAERALGKLPHQTRRRIDEKIVALGTNPRPPGSTKLSGIQDTRIASVLAITASSTKFTTIDES